MRHSIIVTRSFFVLLGAIIILALSATTAKAYDFSANGIYYNINQTTGSAEVTYSTNSYNSYSGNIVIPDAVTYSNRSYNVTAVGENAFRNCSGLQAVTLGANVATIGKRAFFSCSQLTSVEITPSVSMICDYAFAQCENLKNVTFNNDAPIEMGSGAFMRCTQLNNVEWSSSKTLDGRGGITSIGTNAFAHCTALESILLPGELQDMGTTIFDGCNNLNSITLTMDTPLALRGDPFALASSNVSIYVPSSGNEGEAAGLYSQAIGWRDYNIVELPYSFIDNNLYTYLKNPDGSVALTGCQDSGIEVVVVRNSITDWTGNTYNVTSIANETFKGSAIKSLDTSNADKLKAIGNDAFSGCPQLTSINLREGITSMGERAFANCTALSSVKIPSTLHVISKSAFESCISLSNVTLVMGVTTIGENAFAKCSSLQTITLPRSTARVESSAFLDATTLKQITVNSQCQQYASFDGVLYERKYGEGFDSRDYEKMNKLVVYPMAKTNVDYYIPCGVTVIEPYAMQGASHVKNISIPGTTTRFGTDCFKQTNIENINYRNTNPTNDETDGITAAVKANATLQVPVGTLATFTSLEAWQGFKNIVERDNAFQDQKFAYDWNEKDEVTIVDIFTTAVNSAGTLTIPATATMSNYSYHITELRNYCTQNVTTLTKKLVINADSLSVIDTSNDINPLSALQELQSISLTPDNSYFKISNLFLLNYLGTKVYYYLRSSTQSHVTIPNGVEIIMPQAFANNTNLQHISFNYTTKRVENRAFEGCTALQLVDNSLGLITIGKRAFAGCTALTFFQGGEKLNTIDDEAFINCNNLIHFPFAHGMLQKIGNRAFKDCNSLYTAVMSLNVYSLGDQVFENCFALNKVYFSTIVENWGAQVFKGCSSLNELWICNVTPPNVASIFFDQSSYSSAQLFVPQGKENSYRNKSPWNKAASINSSHYLYNGPDVNGDRLINALDITLIMSVLLGDFNDTYVGNFDVNHDGTINVADITLIYNYILTGVNPDLFYQFVKEGNSSIESTIKVGSKIKVKAINHSTNQYVTTGLLGHIDNPAAATITTGTDSNGVAYLEIDTKAKGYCTLVTIVSDGSTCFFKTFPIVVVD